MSYRRRARDGSQAKDARERLRRAQESVSRCRCDKVSFESKNRAREFAAQFRRTAEGDHRNVHAYKCRDDRRVWHIGHSDRHDPVTGKRYFK